jgi:hypothetical protein
VITIIADKKKIKLSSIKDFRSFRYAKNRLSILLKNRYLSKISMVIDISHQPNRGAPAD